MKKIIFLFLFFFSSSVFAFQPLTPFISSVPWFHSYYQFSYNYDVNFVDSLKGNYSDCFISPLSSPSIWYFSTKLFSPYSEGASSCFFLGWFHYITITYTYTTASTTFFDPPQCPNPAYSSHYIFYTTVQSNFTVDSSCVSDCLDMGLDSDECGCPSSGFSEIDAYFVCEMPKPLTAKFVSQETAKKKNELLTESNSKLGIIASTNAAITNLLKQVKDALLSLNSANFRIFGTNADSSSSSSNKDDPNSPEFEPTLLSSDFNLTSISPLMTGGSTCPSDIRLDLAGSSHYISFKPICEFSQKINPFIVAAARVSAAWIVLGAL
jgi:hypothetical protein